MKTSKNMTDPALVRGIREGDHRAFEAMYRQMAPQVFGFAFSLLRSEDSASEITQEVFVKLWAKRSTLRDDLSFSSFLFTITRNTIFNEHNKERHRRAYEGYLRLYLKEHFGDAEAEVIYRDLYDKVQQCIDQLPPRRAEVLRMNREKHMSYREISEALSISERTVEVHIRNAIRDLRRLVKY